MRKYFAVFTLFMILVLTLLIGCSGDSTSNPTVACLASFKWDKKQY